MADTSNITIRMDNKLRKQAEELFAALLTVMDPWSMM